MRSTHRHAAIIAGAQHLGEHQLKLVIALIARPLRRHTEGICGWKWLLLNWDSSTFNATPVLADLAHICAHCLRTRENLDALAHSDVPFANPAVWARAIRTHCTHGLADLHWAVGCIIFVVVVFGERSAFDASAVFSQIAHRRAHSVGT